MYFMTKKQYDNLYYEFSKHLDIISNKYKRISKEDYAKIILSYIDANFDIDNLNNNPYDVQ